MDFGFTIVSIHNITILFLHERDFPLQTDLNFVWIYFPLFDGFVMFIYGKNFKAAQIESENQKWKIAF